MEVLRPGTISEGGGHNMKGREDDGLWLWFFETKRVCLAYSSDDGTTQREKIKERVARERKTKENLWALREILKIEESGKSKMERE